MKINCGSYTEELTGSAGARIADRDLHAAAGRRLPHAQQVELLEQLATLGGGHDLAVDLGAGLVLAVPRLAQRRQRGVDGQHRGDRRPRLPRPQDQIGQQTGAQLPDRPVVAVGAQQLRVAVQRVGDCQVVCVSA